MLKKSSNEIKSTAHSKYKYGSRHFWCREYYVDIVGRNKSVIVPNIIHTYTSSNSRHTPHCIPKAFELYALTEFSKF